MFNLINNNCSLFYLAFVQRDIDLVRQQLMTLLVYIQIGSQLVETLMPSLQFQISLASRMVAIKVISVLD